MHYSYPLALPFPNKRLVLLRLLVKYGGQQQFARLRGSITAVFDLPREEYREKMDFICFFHSGLL